MLAQNDTVQLRRLTPDDLTDFIAYRTDPIVAKFQSWPKLSEQEARGFLGHCETVEPLFRPGEWSQIAVARPDGALLGDMGLHLSEDSAEAELGITIARPFQRQGFATAAMNLAIDWTFRTTPVQCIICGADDRNEASIEMIKKLGFSWSHFLPSGSDTRDTMFRMLRPT